MKTSKHARKKGRLVIYEQFVEYLDGKNYLVLYMYSRKEGIKPLYAYSAMSQQFMLSQLPGIEDELTTMLTIRKGAA